MSCEHREDAAGLLETRAKLVGVNVTPKWVGSQTAMAWLVVWGGLGKSWRSVGHVSAAGLRAASNLLACEHGILHHGVRRVREHNYSFNHNPTSGLLCSLSPPPDPCDRRPDSYGPCVLGMRLLIRHRCPRPSASSSSSSTSPRSRRAGYSRSPSRHCMHDCPQQQQQQDHQNLDRVDCAPPR
jgi:hypothetical protein